MSVMPTPTFTPYQTRQSTFQSYSLPLMTPAQPQTATPAPLPWERPSVTTSQALGNVSQSIGQCSIPGAATTLSALALNVYQPLQVGQQVAVGPASSLSATDGAAAAPAQSIFTVERFIDLPSGLQAAVYKGVVEGRESRVLSFRGTETDSGFWAGAKDWIANIAHGIGFVGFASDPAALTRMPLQYQQAAQIAREIVQGSDLPVLITGHSLAGGLGAYAAIQTGAPAVVFNAAGPQVPSYVRMGIAGLDPNARGTELITQVNSAQDCLTNGVVGAIAGRDWAKPQSVWEINTAGFGDDSGFCSNHGMDRAAKALDEGRPLYHDEAPAPTPYVPAYPAFTAGPIQRYYAM